MAFIPARNKLEAVARISQLTKSGPEFLGPGSKERRSVLDNLGRGLGLKPELFDSKQDMARGIAKKLNVQWTTDCESVGQTITLNGLNILLESASAFFNSQDTLTESIVDFRSEASSMRNILDEIVPRFMDGRSCVLEMKNSDSDNWRQTEWQGWYFEYLAIPTLINRLGGGPRIIGNTKFDYSLIHPWDLKVHSSYGIRGPSKLNDACLLNDQNSIRTAVKEIGLGLVVLSGAPVFNDYTFSAWHKDLRGKTGPVTKQLKNGFRPERLEFFFFENLEDLSRSISNGSLTEFKQGRQPSGEARAPKFSLKLSKARKDKIKIDELDIC